MDEFSVTTQRTMKAALGIVGVAAALVGGYLALSLFSGVRYGTSLYADLAWSRDGKLLAYGHFDSTGDACKSTIYVKPVDGHGKRELTERGEHPSFSPDGGRIAFALLDYSERIVDRGSIAIADADGSHVRRLFTSSRVRSVYACETIAVDDPSWSPDGSLIAFSGARRPGIFVIRPDGTHLRQVTAQDDSYPSWSPDSRWLVFHHHNSEGGRALRKRRRGRSHGRER